MRFLYSHFKDGDDAMALRSSRSSEGPTSSINDWKILLFISDLRVNRDEDCAQYDFIMKPLRRLSKKDEQACEPSQKR